jgi:hypothetical protein
MVQKYKKFSLLSNPTRNNDTEMTFMDDIISQEGIDGIKMKNT